MKLLFVLLTSLLPQLSQAADLSITKAPSLAATAFELYDYTSNQTLVGKNTNERIQPASLTKLMTAYVAFNAIKQGKLSLTQTIKPSHEAVRVSADESRMFLETRKTVSVEKLLHGLIIESGNDAARVLAETIAKDEATFASQFMNKEAQRLGMKNTHFVNATGLPDDQHYSSAHDLALLAAALVRDFPEFYPIYSMREFHYNNIRQYNRNKLLWRDPFVDGMKTGHTQRAGYCLVASAKRNQHRLISVVLGTSSDRMRTRESQRLLNYGFNQFELLPLYKKEQPVSSIRIWKGTEKTVAIGSHSKLYVTIPIKQRKLLKAVLETQQPILAPINEGQVIATLKLKLDGKPYLDLPLVALENVELANVFSRGVDSIRLLFH